MRFKPYWLLFALSIAGCDGASSAAGTSGSGPEPGEVAAAPPAVTDKGSLAVYPNIFDQDEKNGVSVGDKIGEASKVFPLSDSSEKRHYVATPLPKGLSPDDYAATGWELVDGSEGAGFISNIHTKEILAAVIRQTAADSADADKVVAAYTDKFRSIQPVKRVFGAYSYFFWEDGSNRLMILESPGKKDKVQLTIALGVKSVMDFLKADVKDANNDGNKVAAAEQIKSAPTGH